MARETKAQREARMEVERAAEYKQFVLDYPVRFTTLMFNMMELNHVFAVKRLDAERYEFGKQNERYTAVTLDVTPPEFNHQETVDLLEEAERMVTQYREEYAEELRKYQVKQAALAKLTAEEKELLNLQ